MKQLVIYFSLAFSLSWIIWLPLYGPVLGFHNIPVLPFQHAIGGLGPLLASIITTWIFLKKEGLKKLLTDCVQFQPLIYFGIALLSPFLLALLAVLITGIIHQTPLHFSGLLTSKEFPQYNLISVFLYNLIFFGLGEEVGWRGFALPRFQNRINAFTASIAITVLWALWHLPLFLYRPGYTTMGPAEISGWVLSLLTGSILLTWLYNSSRGSILICALFHSTIDIAFTSRIADKNNVNLMGILITIWGILIVLLLKPKNLANMDRVKASNV